MSKADPRLFFLAKNCVDCPKAVFDFGQDEDDLGDWVKTSLKLSNYDHAIKNGVEFIFLNGKLHPLGENDEPLWDGESVPDEVFLSEVEHFVSTPDARRLDLQDKHGNFPLESVL